jgi:hypothetical protein
MFFHLFFQPRAIYPTFGQVQIYSSKQYYTFYLHNQSCYVLRNVMSSFKSFTNQSYSKIKIRKENFFKKKIARHSNVLRIFHFLKAPEHFFLSKPYGTQQNGRSANKRKPSPCSEPANLLFAAFALAPPSGPPPSPSSNATFNGGGGR